MWISIETRVQAPLQAAWQAWITPEDICCWNAASEDWCCPHATSDLRVGERFCYRMEARDGSMGFDFEGRYTRIQEMALIEYEMTDGRKVRIEFTENTDGVSVKESFEAEDVHTAEQQRLGWQAILDRFARHVEEKFSGKTG